MCVFSGGLVSATGFMVYRSKLLFLQEDFHKRTSLRRCRQVKTKAGGYLFPY